MAQNSETVAFNALNYITSNVLSVVLGVGSGVVTSTTHASTISVAGTLDAMYYAALGGAVSLCVKILLERSYKVLQRTWRDKILPALAAAVRSAEPVVPPLSGMPTATDIGPVTGEQVSTSELLPR